MARVTTFSALRWALAGSFLQRVLGFVGLGIITRLLARTADGEAIFGAYQQLVSLHMVVFALLPIGFDQLLIREKRTPDAPRYLAALRATVLLLAGLVAGLALAGQGLLADWLDMGQRAHLLWFVPFIVIIQAIRWGVKPLLVAELSFRRIAAGEFLNTLAVMIGGAALLFVWREAAALYVAFAAGEVAETLWLWRGRNPAAMARVRRNWRVFVPLARRHKRFCGVMGVDQAVNTFSNNSPALLLGGLLGQGAVGLFGMANRLITVPVYLLIGAVSRVTLPALAGREEAELRHRMLLTLRVAAATIPPLLVWIVFYAPVIVTVVLGREWTAETTPILRWLALNLVLQSLFSPISVIDIIRDRPEVTLGWNVANLAVRAFVLWAAAGLGVAGVIAVYSAASAAMWLVYGALLGWLLRAGLARFFWAWGRYVPLWALLAASYWLIGRAIDGDGLWAVLWSAPPAAAYALLVAVMDREVVEVLLRLVRR